MHQKPFNPNAGSPAPAAAEAAREDTGVLYQVSTFAALEIGRYDGFVDFGELAGRGDFGIGTLHKLDGEMVALDGGFYQAAWDGRVRAIRPSQTTPFAGLTFFKPSLFFGLPSGLDYPGLQSFLDKKLASPDLFYALRVDGVFSELELVSAPPAGVAPYPKLAEMIKQRKIYNYQQLTGTLVGFYFPPFSQGVNAPGYHLHFVDAKRQKGGHVQALRTSACRVEAAVIRHLELILPA